MITRRIQLSTIFQTLDPEYDTEQALIYSSDE